MNLEGLTEKRNRVGTVYYENDNGEIVAKRCSNCPKVKLLDDYDKSKKGLGNRQAQCKSCRQEYRNKNSEELSEYFKQHYADNRASKIAYSRRYYSENRDEISDKGKKMSEDKRKLKRERDRRYYRNNKIEVTSKIRLWQKEHKDRVRSYRLKRRTKQAQLPCDMGPDEIKEITEFFGGCVLTGHQENTHWDHVIPVATGHGGYTYGNMVPMRGELNTSKKDSNIFEWFEANRQRFKLEQWRFDRLIDWLASANAMSVEGYRAYVYECHAKPNVIDEDVAN